MPGAAKTILIFSIAVVDAAFLTSIVSTQLVLADISNFGLIISTGDRLHATTHDLLNLGPLLLLLIAPGFLIAFLVARFGRRKTGGGRTLWYMAAGFTSIPAVLYVIRISMGITLLAAARTPLGMLLVACCGLFGGWIFANLMDKFGDPVALDG